MQSHLPHTPGFNPAKKGMPTWLIVVLVVGVVVVVMGVAIALALFGMRQYIAKAKTAEARNSLAAIAKAAVVHYESSAPGSRRLCPSSSKPIPAAVGDVSGKKYQSTPAEWRADESSRAGFACLELDLSAEPQYFQYEYESTPTGFVARAHGDLDGDGTLSTYELRATLNGDTLVVAPSTVEIDPVE